MTAIRSWSPPCGQEEPGRHVERRRRGHDSADREHQLELLALVPARAAQPHDSDAAPRAIPTTPAPSRRASAATMAHACRAIPSGLATAANGAVERPGGTAPVTANSTTATPSSRARPPARRGEPAVGEQQQRQPEQRRHGLGPGKARRRASRPGGLGGRVQAGSRRKRRRACPRRARRRKRRNSRPTAVPRTRAAMIAPTVANAPNRRTRRRRRHRRCRPARPPRPEHEEDGAGERDHRGEAPR